MGPNRMETGVAHPKPPTLSRRRLVKLGAETAAAGVLASLTPGIAIAETTDTPRVPDYKIYAGKELLETAEESHVTAKKTLIETGLEKMVVRLIIAPMHELRVKDIGQRFGKKFEEHKGHGGYTYVNPDGNTLMVIGSQADQQEVRKNTLHEASHMLDPRFKGIDYLVGDFRDEINTRQQRFQASYQKILAEGRCVATYDRDILEGCAIKIGQMAWPAFASAVGLSENDPHTLSYSQIENALSKEDLPEPYRIVLEDFMNLIKDDPPEKTKIADYFNSNMLGRNITKLYWQGKDVLSAFSKEKKGGIEAEIVRFKEEAETEAWAVLGQQTFDNPQLIKGLRPEFYDAFSFIYQKVTGKTFNETAPPLPTRKDLP